MLEVEDFKNIKTKEEAKRKVMILQLSERGTDFLEKNGNKKRISKERFKGILLAFIMNSLKRMPRFDSNKDGGYLDYYLTRTNCLPDSEVIDTVLFFRTIEHLQNMLHQMDYEEDSKFLNVKNILFNANAGVIFEYHFRSKRFQKWQDQLFDLLTLQELPKD